MKNITELNQKEICIVSGGTTLGELAMEVLGATAGLIVAGLNGASLIITDGIKQENLKKNMAILVTSAAVLTPVGMFVGHCTYWGGVFVRKVANRIDKFVKTPDEL